MLKVLVLGASGATGQKVVAQLLSKNATIFAVVRTPGVFATLTSQYPSLSEVIGDVSTWSVDDFCQQLAECDVVISCLGHNLTLKGIFGQPRRLVTQTIDKVLTAINSLEKSNKTKLILMNTTGNANRGIPEVPELSQRIVVSILRYTLPPHVDNEQAADVLRRNIKPNHAYIEWVTVRPDTLTDDQQLSSYEVFESPIRNAIFNAGETSRVNVAHFMASLASDDDLWERWKGKMPVIYNG